MRRGLSDHDRSALELGRFSCRPKALDLVTQVTSILGVARLEGEGRLLHALGEDTGKNTLAIPLGEAQRLEAFGLGTPRLHTSRVLGHSDFGAAAVQPKRDGRLFRNGARQEVIAFRVEMDVFVKVFLARNYGRSAGRK